MDQRHAIAYALIALLVAGAALLVRRRRIGRRRARRDSNRPIDIMRKD
jgi:hypothetical protein